MNSTRKKYLVCIVGFLFVMGLSIIASAITDPGTNYGPLDLTEAKVEVYERPDAVQLMALTITVTPHMPGAIILECDLDDSTGTGGTLSTLGVPVAPCPCKVEPGFDIVAFIPTRRQGDASGSAFCASCSDEQGPCERRREAGEWYAMASLSGQTERAIGILRGLFDPLPKAPSSPATQGTYVLPWSYIKAYAAESLFGNPKAFNWTKSGDPLNNRWQVSIFYDSTNYSTDLDDVASNGSSIFDINDFAPNVGKAPTTIQTNPCEANLNGPEDKDVDGCDALLFKSDFGRTAFSNPCPRYPGPLTY